MGYLCRLNRLNETKGEGQFKGNLRYGGLRLLTFVIAGLECSEMTRRMCEIYVLGRNFFSIYVPVKWKLQHTPPPPPPATLRAFEFLENFC